MSKYTGEEQCCGSGSIFRKFVDPDPYSEYRSGSTVTKKINKRENVNG